MKQIDKVSIALKPNVYTTFRALNNTVSFTLGEYVDNAVQSFLNNRSRLLNLDPNYKLRIDITVDWTNRSIVIEDNAAGIASDNYIRAFEPAHIPIDATGLNEFGMGMKTASVWLANKWCVYTKALGESVERYTEFDLPKVTSEGREELTVKETSMPENEHYTKIVLSDLSKNAPSTSQMDKIRRHLSSIYRKFIRSDEVDIYLNDVLLEAPCYDILSAPYYKTPNEDDILWKKEIDFELGSYKAKGFIAILDKIQNGANGLVLLRRGRVIVGGSDERFFPATIFGQSGNFRYKRLFGELELDGFDVTFNKNGFREEEDLYAFMEVLRDELRSDTFNLLGQADNYRQRKKEQYEKISKTVAYTLKKDTKPKQLTRQIQKIESKIQDTEYLEKEESLILNARPLDSHTESFKLGSHDYTLKIDLVTEITSDMLYSVLQDNNTTAVDTTDTTQIICKINLAHPYFTRFDQFKKGDDYLPIIAIFKALTLAEIMAPNRAQASSIRLLFNQNLLQ